jgi:glycerol-3-phosphate acyltransferase PlsY
MKLFVILLSLLPFYLLGSFPTGYLIAKAKGVDITASGSGNVGATNVARVVGKRSGIFTLLGDLVKGCLGVLLARLIGVADWFVASAAVAVVLGHCFSVPPYLKGGKGVATALGVLCALKPFSAVVALVSFGVVFYISRIVSLASVAAALIVPAAALIAGVAEVDAIAIASIGLILVARHEENIKRLIAGKEPRFSAS